MKDSLGDRIKEYESVFKQKLIKRSYTIIRLDGLGFSKYTSGLNAPFDKGLVEDMIETTKHLCSKIAGCKLGYTQSDEITLVLTDFETFKTQPWYDNDVQKIVSISASLATSKFNLLRYKRALAENPEVDIEKLKQANFDSRVFQVPVLNEVNNTLIWRQRDFERNSISVCASALYSHEFLKFKNSSEKQELIFADGQEFRAKLIKAGYNSIPTLNQINVIDTNKDNFNWNDLPANLKRGTTVIQRLTEKEGKNGEKVLRNVWTAEAIQYSSNSVKELPLLDNATL